jgi:membrane-associated protease RseP (regulator of RpoE activity)
MNFPCQKFISLLFSIVFLSGATFGQTSGSRRVQIGINMQEVDHPESRQLGVDAREGAAITKVFPNSSAELAGLKAGDVIVKCSDRKISTCDALRSVILGSSPGDKHRVEFYRGHELFFVDLIVGQSPQPDGQTIKAADRQPYIAMRAVSAGTASARRMGIESPFGAAVENVVPGGPAAKAGFQRGDLIVVFGGREITNCDDIAAALSRSPIGSSQRVFFVRNNRRVQTAVVIGWRSVDASQPEDNKSEKPGSSQISPPLPQPAQPPTTLADQAPQTPPDGWVTTTIREVTISVPPDWIASEFAAADEGLWYRGSALLPEASIGIVRDTPFTELSRGGVTKNGINTTIGRVPAECCFVETSTATGPEKGMVVMLKPHGADGASLALVCFASAALWDQYEGVFRKVLACLHIRGAGGAESK